MKKIIFCLLAITPCITFAQFGIKAGLNFANVSKAADINNSSKSGFHAGVFLAPPSKKILSYRSEYIYSRQGYNYKTETNTGNVNLDYIQTSQLMSINISKYFSLLFGAQSSYLISANVDSSNNSGSGSEKKIMDLYNRIDYGYAVGAEVHPFMGLTIGAKYNVSLAKIYKSVQSMQAPSFTSEDAKNNVIQLYVGWRFGKNEKKSSNPNN
jgi:hypothetical protein